MKYTSTRNNKIEVNSAFAIANGISSDGGLFVPTSFPQIDNEFILKLSKNEYPQRASMILSKFLTDFSNDEISEAVDGAYDNDNFEENWVCPLADLSDGRYVLELWHGPTCAFKDLALQILPYLLKMSAEKEQNGKQVLILVATSGDTGKAALEGFKDVDGIKVMVFYPNDGVSAMQQLQMSTQEGNNVSVYSIKGNFDDAQTAVKNIFNDKDFNDKLSLNNVVLSSANSINWGRLVPQIVYYFSAYADLVAAKDISNGEKVNFVVPTGNFGDILAAYYAMKMGLPVNKLICASNKNNVLTDFINTGIYNSSREFFKTLSPSMDILVSSNLERLLFDLYDCDSNEISNLYSSLSKSKQFTISKEIKTKLNDIFWGGYASDDECKKSIHDLCFNVGYLCDTHTAVAMNVYDKYKNETKDKTKTIIVSTASPYKFTKSVLNAIGRNIPESEFEAAKSLSDFTKTDIPDSISKLSSKKIRFNSVIDVNEMRKVIFDFSK